MPKLLRDLLEHTLAAESDMVVLVEPEVEALAHRVRDDEADVVIVGLENGMLPAVAKELLARHARKKVVGVEAADGETVVYELQPRRTSIGRASPSSLAVAIRAAAEAP